LLKKSKTFRRAEPLYRFSAGLRWQHPAGQTGKASRRFHQTVRNDDRWK